MIRRALGRERLQGDAIWLIAAGKASGAMARAALAELAPRVCGGLVIAPQVPHPALPVDVVVAEHPEPDSGSEAGGRWALQVSASVPADAELLVLLSGGASSLMAVPADGLALADKRAATSVLLRSGVDIHGLNTVRKHLSAVKGGRLGAGCHARCRAMVLSDVVGDDLSVIASGPTVPDPSTFADALRVVRESGCAGNLPARVMAHLDAGVRGERPETPKPGDAQLAHVRTELVGGRADAMRGAAGEARRLGYSVVVIDDPLVGAARRAGERYAEIARLRAATLPRPVCVIGSGETTVRVTGPGRGGRNQEVALAAAGALEAAGGDALLASVGTDGIDGPTDAAGAYVDTQTLARARAMGLGAPDEYLDNNDAYTFFDALGDLVRTGPTGTNVGDLQVFLLA